MGRREQVILGVPAYTAAALGQSAALRQMAVEARGAIAADRGLFETAHQRRLLHLDATAANAADMQQRVIGATADEAKWALELKNRQQVLAGLQAQVADTNKALEAALSVQTEREQALFEVNQSIAVTVKKNLELERDIRRLEKAR